MNKPKITSRGFTLIELLVVIVIIGIMSSVIIGFLSSARAKGADAGIKSNLNNIRTKVQLYYELANPNSFQGVCGDPNVSAMVTAAGGSCDNQAGTWRASAALKTQNLFAPGSGVDYWCVDQTGIPRIEDSDPNSPVQHTCP